MRSLFKTQTDDGAVTAEFAVVLPAMVAATLFAVGVLSAQMQQLQLQQLASTAVIAITRQQTVSDVKSWLLKVAPGSKLATEETDGVVCVKLSKPYLGVLSPSFNQNQAQSCGWVGQTVAP